MPERLAERYSRRFPSIDYLETVYREITEAIRESRCPFCGRRFKSVTALRFHLMRNEACSKDLVLFTRMVATEYHELYSKIRRLGKYARTKRYLTPDGKTFDNVLQALLHLKQKRIRET